MVMTMKALSILKHKLLWIYINLIRRWKSPLLYWVLRLAKYRGDLPDKWDSIKDLSIDEFHKEIAVNAKYDYLSDLLGGVLDFSPHQKNFFFLDRTTSRDCDNWSRMWKWYFEYHNIEHKEIAMMDIKKKSAHAVTVAKFEDGWELFDYRPTQNREESIDKALENNVVGYDEFVWVVLKG